MKFGFALLLAGAAAGSAAARQRTTINPVDLDYRYLATPDPTFRRFAPPKIAYKTGYETHTLMASLVYRWRRARKGA